MIIEIILFFLLLNLGDIEMIQEQNIVDNYYNSAETYPNGDWKRIGELCFTEKGDTYWCGGGE